MIIRACVGVVVVVNADWKRIVSKPVFPAERTPVQGERHNYRAIAYPPTRDRILVSLIPLHTIQRTNQEPKHSFDNHKSTGSKHGAEFADAEPSLDQIQQ